MLIAFVHDSKAFLPETNVYAQFFAQHGISCEVVRPAQLGHLKPDVAWHFMGTDFSKKRPGTITIHEYTSASMPPLAAFKNLYKRLFHSKPDYRLFLNEFVQAAFPFTDGVPCGYRDMGIPTTWLQPAPPVTKEYDFIYVGEIHGRSIEQLLGTFAGGTMQQHSLLVVSRDYAGLRKQYEAAGNISFAGPVLHEDIRPLLYKARFAINFMPDSKPFNRQTSTKLLEYAACKIPVITSDYYWVRQFQQTYGGSFFYLEKDLSNFSWENIGAFQYHFPDLTGWTWQQQFRRSGLLQFLEQKFPGLRLTVS